MKWQSQRAEDVFNLKQRWCYCCIRRWLFNESDGTWWRKNEYRAEQNEGKYEMGRVVPFQANVPGVRASDDQVQARIWQLRTSRLFVFFAILDVRIITSWLSLRISPDPMWNNWSMCEWRLLTTESRTTLLISYLTPISTQPSRSNDILITLIRLIFQIPFSVLASGW